MPLPDEGLIHAWLDGQLPAEEAERVERLVATDPAWEEAAAEARGLVAASSRILAALDAVPSGVLPAGSTMSRSARRLPWWTKAAAAVVIIIGGSTLVMQRVPAPTITDVPKAQVPVASEPATPKATSPATSPATLPVAPLVPSAAATRRDIAKSTLSAAPATTAKAAPALAVPAIQPPPQALASARERAEAPAAAITQRQESRAVGGVASGNALALQAQRVADQRIEVQRAAEQQAGAQRDASAPVMAKVGAPSTVNQAAKALAEVPTVATATPLVAVGACYALRDSRTSAATGIVMRGDKQVADTLFLAPLRPSLPARGWVTLRDGVLRGVLTTEAEGRGMVLVTAVAVPCTTP